MSIRDAPPPYDTNVPVVTSAGGTSAAYRDPNSPESLMKKATLMQAQAAVDSTYDVKEGFSRFPTFTLLPFILAVSIVLFLLQNRIKKPFHLLFWFAVAIGIIFLLRIFHLTE